MHTCATVQRHLPSERCAILAGFLCQLEIIPWIGNGYKTWTKPLKTRIKIKNHKFLETWAMEPELWYSSKRRFLLIIIFGFHVRFWEVASQVPAKQGKKSRKPQGVLEPNDMLDIRGHLPFQWQRIWWTRQVPGPIIPNLLPRGRLTKQAGHERMSLF